MSVARQYLNEGLIIAYPTEAVYGFGCDPFNEDAVLKILKLKSRSKDKGLILLISDWEQLFPLIGNISDACLEKVKKSWPGHTTWIFPKSDSIPYWLSGNNSTIAIRMTNHKISRELCKYKPIVSTSANLQNQEPVRDLEQIKHQFSESINGVVLGDLGGLATPSEIYDIISGMKLR